jgi:rod shape-determining protein MreC
LSVLSLLLTFIPEQHYGTIQMSAASVFVPAQKATSFATQRLAGFAGQAMSGLALLVNRRTEVQKQFSTQQRISSLENEIIRQESEIRRLRQALDSLKGIRKKEAASDVPAALARIEEVHPGTIISVGSTNWTRTLIVNVGSRDGIKPNMPVVWNEAIVGRIAKVGPYASAVQLITDPQFRIWVIDVSSREQGIVRGTGSPTCLMSYVPLGADIKKGDWLVSSGLAGTFPRDFVVGQVAETPGKGGGIYLDIAVKPRIDIRKLETVYILKMEKSLFDL